MSKRISVLFLCIVLACSALAGTAMAAGDEPIEIYADGEPAGSAGDSIMIDGTVYVPLRAVCEALGGTVSWDAEANTAFAALPGTEIEVMLWRSYITANGRVLYDESVSVMLEGSLLLPARQLARALAAEVGWDAETRTVSFTSGAEPIESADTFYDSDDLYWLSRIICCEAGSESLEGKIAVGNVVLNRVADPAFPDTIYGVIFQRGQFSPVSNGAINRSPNDESVLAAKMVLEGAYVVDGALFFQNTAITGSNWMSRNREVVVKLGNHTFYA